MNAPQLLRPVRFGSFAVALCFAVLTGRAQITESPATVAPGSFLMETDALSWEIDREGQDKYRALVAGSVLLTTGLTQNWDIQVGAELYVQQRFESGSFTERHSGVGDLYVRTKWRFLSNDWMSMAILPYAKIPTNSGGVGNKKVEGGVIVPWENYLFGGFLTLNSQVDVSAIRNANDDGYEFLLNASSAATKEITKFLSIYGEINAAKSRSSVPWQVTAGVGAYLTLSDRLALDFAAYRGLNPNATDWNPVVRVNYSF